jgi:HEAT repeat protein
VQDLAACIVRVCAPNGENLGTGFVVSDRLAVTCAHVVELCGAGPGDPVRIVFHTNGQYCQAQILSDYWRSPDGDDVVVLRLLPESELVLQGIVPARLGSARHCNGHDMRALGFPPLEGGYDVAWAEGKLRGVVPHPAKQPMLQMRAEPIRQGMSGAPVLDLDTGRVVGVVKEYLADAPLEWATTADTLHDICPEIPLYPPQTVEDYLDAMHDYCANLPYLTLHDIRPPKTLDEVYVPLKAQPQPRKDESQTSEVLETSKVYRRAEPLSIAEVMRSRKQSHVLILGEPGAGKSSLLRQLAERAWNSPEKIGLDAPCLPILVPLRRLAGADGSLEKRLADALTGELALTQALPEGFFTEWPDQTDVRWLILLDALDEVPADERARLMQWLKGTLKSIGQSRIVITSRPSGYSVGELDDKLFGHYDLLSFTPEQTGEFAHKWLNEKADDFLRELDRVRAGELRGTPLLLTIAANVYLERGTLPERRSALYGQFVDIWLAEAEQRGLKAELGERMCKVAKFGLAKLALAMTEWSSQVLEEMTFKPFHEFWLAITAPSQVSQAMLEQVTTAYLRDALRLSDDEAEADGRKFVQVMARQSGVFTRRGEVYDFVHPTFREYLAAYALVHEFKHDDKYDLEQACQRVMSHREEWSWREVVLFTLSILSDACQNDTVTTLVKRTWQEEDEKGLYFAGHVLAEQVKVDEDLSDGIIGGLLARAREWQWYDMYQPASSNVFSVLSELHSYPRVGEGLLALAHDEKVEESARARAIEALGRLGRVDDLLALARNDKIGARVREYAAEMLSKLGDEAVPILLALARDAALELQTRMRAGEALGHLGRVDEAVSILLALARDEKMKTWQHEEVAKALGELGRADEAAQVWLTLARDEAVEVGVRIRAAESLGKLGRNEEAAPILLGVVGDVKVDWFERKDAVKVLSRLWRVDETELDPLVSRPHDKAEYGENRVHLAKVLGRLKHFNEAVHVLLSVVYDKEMARWVRADAAEALGHFADVHILAELEQIAQEDRSIYVRRAAQQAIEMIRRRAGEHDNKSPG